MLCDLIRKFRNSLKFRTKGFKGTALDWLPVHPNNALYGPTCEAIRNYADAFNYYYVYPIRDVLSGKIKNKRKLGITKEYKE